MKKLFFLIFAVCFAGLVSAQEKNDSTQKRVSVENVDKTKGAFFIEVPKKLNIKDKIFVQNNTQYLILQMVVAVDYGDGNFVSVGNASYIGSNVAVEIASFSDNSLKHLRGKRLLIKVKGVKINPIVDGAKVNVNTPLAHVHVDTREIDKDFLKDIDESQITYDFHARLYENSHDLYIDIQPKDVLDF